MNKATIKLHQRPVESVFELLGSDENSISYSIGWSLAQCPDFLQRIADRIFGCHVTIEEILLQQHCADRGYTDIELVGPYHHAIIEAKRGWWLPSQFQFERYRPRFGKTSRINRSFVAMSDCTSEYANLRLPNTIDNIPMAYIGWRDIESIAHRAGKSNAEKRLMRDLTSYLRKVATMQDKTSNMVFVVSLGGGIPDGGALSWIDIVEKRRQYFHQIGNRWPKEAPNYIAFRYDGRLQSIHHIDDYVISTNSAEFGGLPNWDWETTPHFVYQLGPAIRPPHEVRTGHKIQRSARVWVMLDLLLTCSTITEALMKTKERFSNLDK